MAASGAYLYILTNPSMAGLLKIGYAADVRKRVAQLNAPTSVAMEFEIAYQFWVDDARRLEQALHKRFAHVRTRNRREFFRMPVDEVKDAIDQLIRPSKSWREIEKLPIQQRESAKCGVEEELSLELKHRRQQERDLRKANLAREKFRRAMNAEQKVEAVRAEQQRLNLQRQEKELLSSYRYEIEKRRNFLRLFFASIGVVVYVCLYGLAIPTSGYFVLLIVGAIILDVFTEPVFRVFLERRLPLREFMRERGYGLDARRADG